MIEKNNGERSLRILHVENSPWDAEIIRKQLINSGFSLHLDWATSEKEFTSFLQSGGYDLVLADYDLPGFDVTAALRLTKSLCPGVPFICVSSAIGEDIAVGLIKQGATDYVSKRRLDKLPLAIKRALDEVREHNARQQAEQALRVSEEKIRLLLNSSGEAIYGLDSDGNCTFCNSFCLHLLGYKHPEELLGKNMHWQIHAKYSDGTHYPIEDCRIFQAFKEGVGRHVDDEVLWRSDGTSFPAEYSAYPQLRDGVVVGAVMTFRDITKRKQTEERLRQLETRIRQSEKMEAIGQESVCGEAIQDTLNQKGKDFL